MDKKIQFQIQTSQGKLIKYKQIISELEDNRKKICITTESSTPNKCFIIELQNKQIYLEDKQQQLKKHIYLNLNEISDANKKLSLLDTLKENKLKEENNILQDEIIRIKDNIIDINKIYQQKKELAYNDKLELLNNIEIIKNELILQNNIISEIQINSHCSRKKTLEELHINKQNKIFTNENINNINENDANFNNQIKTLENKINDIIEFKKLIIDSEYNLDYDNSKLNLYYTEFDLDIQLSINDKISILDNLISDNKNKIQFINKKFNKIKQINNIKLQNILDTYNQVNRVKVIGYKDQFKIEKDKRTQLENILADLYDKYNTFDSVVISNLDNEIKDIFNELENDKIRSNERLDIMKIRILEEYKNENDRLNKIITNSKSTLEVLYHDFNDIKTNIVNTKEIINKENIIGIELEKIDNDITKYQSIIKQIESDIEKLSSTL